MKTIILILSVLIISLSVPIAIGSKEKVRKDIQVRSTELAPPIFTIDNTKPAGSLRVMVKPLCYDDLNLAYLHSVKGGC